MPSPPGWPEEPNGAGAGASGGARLGEGEGACAARAADTPTRLAKASQKRQRLGKERPRCDPTR
ncbi:MAG: hypothetical protein ACK54Z_08960 [Cyanobacteriota bacterium]